MDATAPDLLDTLKRAEDDLEERLSAVRRAKRELIRKDNNDRRKRWSPSELNVGEHHMNAVYDYLFSKGPARQADIHKDLGLNSGTVSNALRKMEGLKVERLPEKLHGATVWKVSDQEPKKRRGRPRKRQQEATAA